MDLPVHVSREELVDDVVSARQKLKVLLDSRAAAVLSIGVLMLALAIIQAIIMTSLFACQSNIFYTLQIQTILQTLRWLLVGMTSLMLVEIMVHACSAGFKAYFSQSAHIVDTAMVCVVLAAQSLVFETRYEYPCTSANCKLLQSMNPQDRKSDRLSTAQAAIISLLVFFRTMRAAKLMMRIAGNQHREQAALRERTLKARVAELESRVV